MSLLEWTYEVTVTDYNGSKPHVILDLAMGELTKEIDINNSQSFTVNECTVGVRVNSHRLMALLVEEIDKQIRLASPVRFGYGFGHTEEAKQLYNLEG